MNLIQTARKLYEDDCFAVEPDQTVYALDTTTIDLCLAVFPWARFRSTKAAVKKQIWIAITAYVLVSIVKKHLNLKASLYTILQILSLTLFEKTPLDQLLKEMKQNTTMPPSTKQRNLFG